MSLERIYALVAQLRARVARAEDEAAPSLRELPRADALELVESMLLARHLDVAAHDLRASGHGHYTICSSGHESNAVVGRLTDVKDPALLHYRSAAFQIERARKVPGSDVARDIVASLVAATTEPTSGGRHKVFGGRPLGIIPATSTIASHLPRAVGLALALERRARLGLAGRGTEDAIVVASFGDASLNHSTAIGALNAASWTLHQRLTLPALFVCEDNGLGISVRSPEGWVATRLAALPHLRVFHARGWDLAESWRVAGEAVDYVRRTRRAAVLHLECVRLLGHAGSDVDATYRTPAELAAAEALDPVTTALVGAVREGYLDGAAALALDAAIDARVRGEAERARGLPRHTTRASVMSALIDPKPIDRVAAAAPLLVESGGRGLTLAQGINQALEAMLTRHGDTLLFGEDVAKKGGVYGVTKGLLAKAGPARVFNTLLDEQTILGLALGAATAGLVPIPEIQYLAYLHNAEDQLRGEAATQQFFSQRAYDNPMVVRIAGLAYQKGFGGHFHNDDSLAVLRDIPGLLVAVPARGDDAVAILSSALSLARESRRVVVIVEPIALYHTRDLREPGDGLWLGDAPEGPAIPGRARVYSPEGRDLTIATYGNGLLLSRRVAKRLEAEHGVGVRVLDLRWIVPLPVADLLEHASATGRLLIVDECRKSGSPSEELCAALIDAQSDVVTARVTSADSYVPLGEAADLVLVSEAEIHAAALALLDRPRRR